jgi:dihydropteroate synthase
MDRFSPPTLKIKNNIINFDAPVIMAIINVTKDSFYDGGKHFNHSNAIEFGKQAINDGAHILDIGGESTRPGSKTVSASEEIERVIPVVSTLAKEGFIVSIDTTKSEVAEAALQAGATIVNDISGGIKNPEIIKVTKNYNAVFIAGHMRGTPQNMQSNIDFTDLVEDVKNELSIIAQNLLAQGISKNHIIIDPGIGFGKTAEQCALLIREAGNIGKQLKYPVLLGPSNKSFIGKLTGATLENRGPGTITSCILGWQTGSHIFRVHNVNELQQAFTIYNAIISP